MTLSVGVSSSAAGGAGPQTTSSVTTQATKSTFIICADSFRGGGLENLATPTDSKSNLYVPLAAQVVFSGFPVAPCRWWYCENGVGGAGHTASITGTADTYALSFLELKSDVTYPTLDQASVGRQDTASPFTSDDIITTVADEILVAFAAVDGASIGTWGNSFVAQTSGPDPTGGMATRVVSATGTYQSSLTAGGGATEAVCFIASFKEFSSGQAATLAVPALLFAHNF